MSSRRGRLLLLALALLLVAGALLAGPLADRHGGGASPRDPAPTAQPTGAAAPSRPAPSPTATPTRATLPSLEVSRYRVIKQNSPRVVPRGRWHDLAHYRVQPDRPTTHVMQVNLNVRRATGPRPTHVTVGWLVHQDGERRRVGVATFAVPTFRGDYPFQVTHRFTTMGTTGRAVAQVLVEGSGDVRLPLSVIKAIVWPDPATGWHTA